MLGRPRTAAGHDAVRGRRDESGRPGRSLLRSPRTRWPSGAERGLNTLPKTVASTTLREAPWGGHAPARTVPDAIAHVQARRAGPAAGTTIVWGSVTVVADLLRAGEVDDVELFVAPVLLGVGRPLLRPDVPPARLVLRETGTWPGGVLRIRYAVDRSATG